MDDCIHSEEYETDDGWTFVLRVYPDYYATLEDDGDWFGSITPTTRHPYYCHDAERPAGYNGRARKISARDGSWWWQPPADVADEHLASFASSIRDILEYGYSAFVVDATSPSGFTGSASYGMIEPFAPTGLEDYPVSELANEARGEAEDAEARRWAKVTNTSVTYVRAMLEEVDA